VRVHVLGDRSRLTPGGRAAVERVERETAAGTRLSLNLCISYSSRGEIARAARLLAEEVLKGTKQLEDIDEEAVRSKLYTAPWCDPDLLIRTSGEQRISNFCSGSSPIRSCTSHPCCGRTSTGARCSTPSSTISAAIVGSVKSPRPDARQQFAQRIIVAAIAIPAVVGIIWLGGWVLAGTLAILGVLGAREIYDFGRRQGIEPLDRTGWLAAAGIPLLAYWAKGSELHWAEPALYLGALWLMVVLVIAMMRRGPTGRPLTSVSITLFGCLYASGLLTFLIAIRHGSQAGFRPAGYALLTLFPRHHLICDTAAMAVGRSAAQLALVLSPKKTYAGAVAGRLRRDHGLALGNFSHPAAAEFFQGSCCFRPAVSIVGQIGDVANRSSNARRSEGPLQR
jgi:CDP-diglyceride synthetase